MTTSKQTIDQIRKSGEMEAAILESFTMYNESTLDTDTIDDFIVESLMLNADTVAYVKNGSEVDHNTYLKSQIGWERTSMKNAGSLSNTKQGSWKLLDHTQRVMRLTGKDLLNHVDDTFKLKFQTSDATLKKTLATKAGTIRDNLKEHFKAGKNASTFNWTI